jgi:hypothetical protein
MASPDYEYTGDTLPLLLISRHFPERTDGESAIIYAFLSEFLPTFDRITFGKRTGKGAEIDPATIPEIQRSFAFSTRKRIDILAWRGTQPLIVEVKQRVTPAALGQILTYRHHFVEEHPDAPEPELVVVGRESDQDTIDALVAHGVTVHLYPEAIAGQHAAGSRL